MADIPEPSKEVQPIFRDSKKEPRLPYPDKVVVPELPDSIKPKVAMPAKSSLWWDGIRHFLFGVLEGGGGALAALATAGMMANPAAWPIVGACAVGFGVVEAGRKVAKEKSGGKDWTDILYQVLQLILKAFQTKGGAK